MTESIRTSWDLLFAGDLPPWLVLVIMAGGVAAVIYLLRRELRRRRARGAARWLYVLRVAIVILLALVLAQPILALRREHTRPGPLLVVPDHSASMLRTDGWHGSALLDLAATTGERLDDRESRPKAAAALLGAAEPRLVEGGAEFRNLYEQLSQGLPWGESFDRTLAARRAEFTRMLEEMQAQRESLHTLEAAMREQAESVGDSQATLPSFTPEPFAAFAATVEAFEAVVARLREQGDEAMTTAAMEQLVSSLAMTIEQAGEARQLLRELQSRADELYWEQLPETARESLAALAARPRIELVEAAFAELVRLHPELPFEAPDWAAAAAAALPGTDLYAQLAALLEDELTQRQVSGIVLISDGGQNLPERPEVLRQLRKRGVPLHTVGVGSEEPVRDIAIVDYTMPALVRARHEVPLSLRLKTAVPEGTRIEVIVTAGGTELARRGLEADGAAEMTLELMLRAPEEDVGPLTLKAAMEAPDAAPDNDEVRVPLHVVRTEARVLLVARAPRWDLVYLMRALRQLPVNLDTVFWGALKEDEEPRRGSGSGRIPDQAARLKRYDLVILDGPLFPGYGDADTTLFRGYAEQGGALLLNMDAQGGSYFAELGDGAVGELRTGELRPASTPPAPAVALSADPSRTLALWRELASPSAIAVAPPSDVPLLIANPGETPVFALRFVGAGRIYTLSIGDLFRLREWEGGPSVNRFMAALTADLLTPLAGGEELPLIYPSLPLPGGQAYVVGGGAWRLTAAGNESPLAVGGEATVQPVALPREAELALSQGEVTRTVHLAKPVSAEALVLNLQSAVPRAMSAAAGGSYVSLAELQQLPERIEIKPDIEVTFRQIRLWNLPFLLLLVVALMTIDWVLRRHCGLIL